MKILLLNDSATPSGGAELMTLALHDELRGHDARLFSSTARYGAVTIQGDYKCHGTTGGLRTPRQVFKILQLTDNFARLSKLFSPTSSR